MSFEQRADAPPPLFAGGGLPIVAEDTSPDLKILKGSSALDRRTCGEFLNADRLIGGGTQKWLETSPLLEQKARARWGTCEVSVPDAYLRMPSLVITVL